MLSAGAEGVTLLTQGLKGRPGHEAHIPYADIDRAQVQVEFARGTNGLPKLDGFYLSGVWSEAWGRDAVARLFGDAGMRPDALFCGNDQIARGETVPYSKELMEQIGQRAVQRAKQGHKIDNPDVIP